MNNSAGIPGTMIPQAYVKALELLKKTAQVREESKGGSDD